MKLKSFGCSFIFGSDLSDCFFGSQTPSQKTWPALLAKKLGANYQCFARGGAGNLVIAERVLMEARSTEPSLFVVNWTYIDRFDYKINDGVWECLRPSDAGPANEFYFRNLHSQYKDKLTSLMYIKLVIDVLQKYKHQFIMTYMDHLLFETEWHSTQAVVLLQDEIRTHLHSFDGDNLLDYGRKLGFPISKNNHLLDEGHQACFSYAAKNFGH